MNNYKLTESSFKFNVGYDLYEVLFTKKESLYKAIIFVNNQCKKDDEQVISADLNTATNLLSKYLTTKNKPAKV